MLGGILGLIGVGFSLFFSWMLNKNNREFQNKLNTKNQEFQKELALKEKEHKLWMTKYNTLINLISYQFDFGTKEFQAAINGIPAVFHDSDDVMKAIKRLHEYMAYPQRDSAITHEKLVVVYTEIFKDLGIDQNVDEVFLKKVFNAR